MCVAFDSAPGSVFAQQSSSAPLPVCHPANSGLDVCASARRSTRVAAADFKETSCSDPCENWAECEFCQKWYHQACVRFQVRHLAYMSPLPARAVLCVCVLHVRLAAVPPGILLAARAIPDWNVGKLRKWTDQAVTGEDKLRLQENSGTEDFPVLCPDPSCRRQREETYDMAKISKQVRLLARVAPFPAIPNSARADIMRL